MRLVRKMMGGNENRFPHQVFISIPILFLSLMAGIVKEDSVRDVALFLTDNMAIFFIPALMGILEMWGLIKMHFLAWVALLTITALLVMAVSGWTKQLTDRIRRRK